MKKKGEWNMLKGEWNMLKGEWNMLKGEQIFMATGPAEFNLVK